MPQTQNRINRIKKTRKNMKGGQSVKPLSRPSPLSTNVPTTTQPTTKPPEHGGLMDVIGPAFNLATNASLKAITTLTNMAANAAGVDITKNDLPSALEKIDKVLSNPNTQEQVGNIAKKVGEDATILLQAVEPTIKKATEEIGQNVIEMAGKEGKSAISTLKDLSEEIPGVATFYVANDALKAIEAGVDAGAKTFTTLSDAVTETEGNLEQMKQKGMSLTNPLTGNIPALTGKIPGVAEANKQLGSLMDQRNAAQQRIEETKKALSETDMLKNMEARKRMMQKGMTGKMSSIGGGSISGGSISGGSIVSKTKRYHKNNKKVRVLKTRKSCMAYKTKKNKHTKYVRFEV